MENPNSSPLGLIGFTDPAGRFTIMMPHPERLTQNRQFSHCPEVLKESDVTWGMIFRNARRWLEEHL
jgi:phosphoribosylformylglycinamidine synthase